MESDRRVGWRKGVVERRGEPGGRAGGEEWPADSLWGGGWKALRLPSTFLTKCGDSSGFERLPEAGRP